ncbi:F-type H+-transporting ATPase subunit epsilon [Plasmodium vinckei vinckei]|nr:F-type H+-transporting ATPase subunit epsilon [Plasmodium vinckei vinckei]
MAHILRKCLKDPYSDIALERSKMHLREVIYKDGKPISQGIKLAIFANMPSKNIFLKKNYMKNLKKHLKI